MIHVLAQTLTAQPTLGAQIAAAVATAVLALLGGAVLLVPPLLAWARNKIELERVKTQDALDEARKARGVSETLAKGAEAVMAAQTPSEAKKTKEILAAVAEESGRFADVRATVREVTHPEEKKEEPKP